MALIERVCACGEKFMARQADVNRGWAKSCSKSCAATKTNKKTGNYQRFMRSKNAAIEYEESGEAQEFSDAHLFSHEENDNCDKDRN